MAADTVGFLVAVSVTVCKGAAIRNVLTAVSVTVCKGAAITNFLEAVSVALCEGAVAVVSVAS